MRHPAIVVAIAATLVLSACGDVANDDPVEAQEPAADELDAQPAGDEPEGDAAADEPAADVADGSESPARPATAGSTPADPATGKPSVQLPLDTPTELVVTDVIEGTGDAAATGDTIVLDYVGVLSADGTEFDNSYDGGQPLTLTLGVTQLIEGFTAGLEGVQTGTRRQLDIPAALAYGDQGAGDVIPPGAAISFVVDIESVTKREPPTVPAMADPSECPATDGSEEQRQEFTEMVPFCIDVAADYTAEVVTNFGAFTIALDPVKAPQNVNNFVTLARYRYFDGTECHRVLTDFVVQCGDPDASGFGGPGYTIPDELPLPGEYEIGSIAMANTGAPDSAGSQFFIISGPQGAALPPQYSLFGQVAEGFPVVSELNTLENPDGENGTPPLETIVIESVTITES